MVAATIGMSILAFIAIIIGTALGAGNDGGLGKGVWPVVYILPAIGLPIGFVLIIVLLVTTAVRRGRAAKGAGK